MTTLPKKLALRQEHTGAALGDRAQLLARQVATAHEQTKAYVAAQASTLAGFMSIAAIAMNDANQTATATQVGRGTIITTGAITVARTLSGFPRPVSTDGSDWYWRFFWNRCTGGFNVLLNDGVTTLTIGSGGQFAVAFTNAGPVVLR